MEDPQATILIVEDDPRLSEMLMTILEGEGYTTCRALTGAEAMRCAIATRPDIILLDIMLPDISGFEVLQTLRTTPKTMHVPVIILTASQDINDKLHAFHAYVNDYLTKPFNASELLVRVRAHLHHARATLLSPLTMLPGGMLVEYAITHRLENGQPWALLYLDLDHFKALNDAYGFVRGNEMILMLTDVIIDTVAELGQMDDFIGHVGGEDFVILTVPERAEILCQSIIARFRDSTRHFYRAEDIARGTFLARGRDDEVHFFPLVTLSIAVLLSTQPNGGHNLETLAQRAAELKTRSKAIVGNSYVIDGHQPVYVDHSLAPDDRRNDAHEPTR